MVLGKYLRKAYLNGKLKHESVDLFPVDIGHWRQSILLDKRDGYNTTYKTKPSKTGLTRYVVFAKSVPVDSRDYLYTFSLLGLNYPVKKLKV